MIALTTQLIDTLLGSAFVAWLNCDVVRTLFAMFIFAFVVKLFLQLVNNKI